MAAGVVRLKWTARSWRMVGLLGLVLVATVVLLSAAQSRKPSELERIRALVGDRKPVPPLDEEWIDGERASVARYVLAEDSALVLARARRLFPAEDGWLETGWSDVAWSDGEWIDGAIFKHLPPEVPKWFFWISSEQRAAAKRRPITVIVHSIRPAERREGSPKAKYALVSVVDARTPISSKP